MMQDEYLLKRLIEEICFQFVPDSIGTVQARVRARTADCLYYLITTKGTNEWQFTRSIELFEYLDSSNYKKEIESRESEQDLKEALDAWKRYSSDEFKQRVMERKV